VNFDFLKKRFMPWMGALVFFSAMSVLAATAVWGGKAGGESLHPALYWEALKEGLVRCVLCPNRCVLQDGQIGACKARKNVRGKLYSLVYGVASSVHLDPIEKKPFYHFLPGSGAYSVGTTGCNLQCKFCQNWQIAQIFPWQTESRSLPPAELVDAAVRLGARSIAFTYNEPTIAYEYVLDTAKLARAKGLKTVLVSSGYINQKPLEELLLDVDGYKIDLKGFEDRFYRDLTSGSLAPVLEAIQTIHRSGVWLEIVNLVIPGENDRDEEILALSKWVKENLGEDVPLHFTRFHPQYKLLNKPPTPFETLAHARKLALGVGLRFVYTGNAADEEGGTTYDPVTGVPLIRRVGFFVTENRVNSEGVSPDGTHLPGVWS